jgi:transposase
MQAHSRARASSRRSSDWHRNRTRREAKSALTRIKNGNRYLRKLLVVGAHAVLFHRRSHQDGLRTWAAKLMETKPFKLVAVAVANKVARIALAVMRDGSIYGTAVP